MLQAEGSKTGFFIKQPFPKSFKQDIFGKNELFIPFQISYPVGYEAYIVTLSFHSFLHYT